MEIVEGKEDVDILLKECKVGAVQDGELGPMVWEWGTGWLELEQVGVVVSAQICGSDCGFRWQAAPHPTATLNWLETISQSISNAHVHYPSQHGHHSSKSHFFILLF